MMRLYHRNNILVHHGFVLHELIDTFTKTPTTFVPGSVMSN